MTRNEFHHIKPQAFEEIKDILRKHLPSYMLDHYMLVFNKMDFEEQLCMVSLMKFMHDDIVNSANKAKPIHAIDAYDIVNYLPKAQPNTISYATYRKPDGSEVPVGYKGDRIDILNFNEKKRVTTVKWKDGTITQVRCSDNDYWDPEKALAMCYTKRWIFMNDAAKFHKAFKKNVPETEEMEFEIPMCDIITAVSKGLENACKQLEASALAVDTFKTNVSEDIKEEEE